jgi:2',3'-cyclic-nucleotide 2'-phosphodiesterase (5'-nucleotidase family)
VIGLLLTENGRVLRAAGEKGLKMVPMLLAVKRYLPEMGCLDLTVLMVHDDMQHIEKLAEAIPAGLGVDIILSGHNHLVLEEPLFKNGIYIFQAGAMNSLYGEAELMVSDGGITSMKNRIVKLMPSPLARVSMFAKEAVDALGGERFAVLKQPLLGASLRDQENSLGDFVTDAFRWATGTDVAMTNSSSLRRDFHVYPGESALLNEGDFKTMCPFQNHLVVGKATGAQILQIVEGDALYVSNQVSGIRYTVDPKKPCGKRVIEARIGGEPVVLDRVYTLTHNSFCSRPENMEKYLHLKPGSIEWKETNLLDQQVLIDYARKLKVIDYPSEGKGSIVKVP